MGTLNTIMPGKMFKDFKRGINTVNEVLHLIQIVKRQTREKSISFKILTCLQLILLLGIRLSGEGLWL